jgi:TRAP-type mannitol/chloroaromatic compound transport system permease large subunit
MTDPQVAVSMLAVLILAIFLGFPVAFTLMALGVGYGFYAYYDQALLLRVYERLLGDETGALMESFTWLRALFNNRIFDLFVNQTYSVMSNDVLTSIPLFLFMGYILERVNVVERLFHTLFIATYRLPGAMAVAAW